jgi:NAD(P)-dependent dehydrogenase (short-subunit alcohol dehydrogenase family)
LNFSRDPQPALQVAAACREYGADVLVERADVADDGQCVRLAHRVQEHFGRCDALVNNAGTTKFVRLRDLKGLDAEDFQKIYAVNVIGAFQMTRALVPLLKERDSAAVVNVSSLAAVMGMGSSIAYIASKGALNSMTLALARALAPHIRVNAVGPGMVDSRWLREGLGAEGYAATQRAYESASSMGSSLTPQEVAETIFWFGAGASRTTGEFQLVDAGRYLGRV